MNKRHRHRTLLFLAALLCGAAVGLGLDSQPAPALQAQQPSDEGATAGIRTSSRQLGDQQFLVIESIGRFELRFDASGIVAWYDLPSDPLRQTNLVASGSRLLDHRHGGLGGAPALQGGRVLLREANDVRAVVRIEHDDRLIDHVVWAGGQVAYEVRSTAPATTSVGRDLAAARGAALQPLASYRDASGRAVEQGMLYLDSWQPEPLPAVTSTAKVAPAVGAAASFSGAVRIGQPVALPLELTLPPDGGVRQPRFEIEGWPAAALSLRRGGTTLVEGADYIASWEQASGLLMVQYLHLLPPGDARSFELSNAPAATSLRLGIAGKTIDEAGLLIVDANLPSFSGSQTTQDVFKIPYIQTGRQVEAVATVQEAPTGARVRFVLNDAQEIIDASEPFTASFTLPARGTHQLRAELLDAGGTVLATGLINPLAYGEVLVSIGDSITNGFGGYRVGPGPTGIGPGPYVYPIGSAAQSPLASADARNFYQADNWDNANEYYYASYQTRLNDLLTACSSVPVFILNDGFSGIRTGVPGNSNTVVAKLAAYRSHIDALGARHVLLTIGTNDVSESLGEFTWANRDLTAAIDGLQTGNDGLTIWVGRVPWRNDENPTTVQRTEAYNALIPGIVSAQNSASSPVALGPDFYTYFKNQPPLFADPLHPTQAGYDGMAQLWSDATCTTIAAAPPPEFDNTVLLSFVQR